MIQFELLLLIYFSIVTAIPWALLLLTKIPLSGLDMPFSLFEILPWASVAALIGWLLLFTWRQSWNSLPHLEIFGLKLSRPTLRQVVSGICLFAMVATFTVLASLDNAPTTCLLLLMILTSAAVRCAQSFVVLAVCSVWCAVIFVQLGLAQIALPLIAILIASSVVRRRCRPKDNFVLETHVIAEHIVANFALILLLFAISAFGIVEPGVVPAVSEPLVNQIAFGVREIPNTGWMCPTVFLGLFASVAAAAAISLETHPQNLKPAVSISALISAACVIVVCGGVWFVQRKLSLPSQNLFASWSELTFGLFAFCALFASFFKKRGAI